MNKPPSFAAALPADPETIAQVSAAYDVAGAVDRGAFDDLAEFIGALCEVPIALVTVMDDQIHRFIARLGTDLTESPRAISFCTHAMEVPGVTEVPDASLDPRFAENPLVTGPLHLRFYAGVPLVSAEGVAFGTVCVFDTEPRAGLTDLQRQGMDVVARAALARLDTERGDREETVAAARRRHTLEDSERRFRTLADAMPQMVWSTLPDGFHDYYNARWYEYTGVPEGTTDGEAWNGVFHPDDQERAWALWRHSLSTGDPYQIEYRLRHADGTYRWVLGRALPMRDATGAITRWFGTCTDIHEQKLALEEREVVSQELSHRIKNIFAVIAGLVGFAARGRPEFAPMATDLRQRITALGRAHDFVRPHSATSRPTARQDSLHGLLDELFEAYQGRDDRRIRIEGDDVAVDDRSATPLALLFHELATNATKYGALSKAGGTITVRIAADDDHATTTWIEQGGPPIAAPPAGSGFGSQLVELSAVRQLGGTVTREWRPDGLSVTVTTPIASFSRR
ncbi:sensor histidine kinase [Sphingomonas sp.]|uniref:sensor histidine kinase n=1 Tax=Sphingomonas sp. TaxID=28214 RepID=UPI0035BBF50D